MSKNQHVKIISQLDMTIGRASNILKKKILFSFLEKQDMKCHRCGESLTYEDFTIDHKTPWLDSEDPAETFFDLENIAYSHLACNAKVGRRPHKKWHTKEEKLRAKAETNRKSWHKRSAEERKARRKEKYLRTKN